MPTTTASCHPFQKAISYQLPHAFRACCPEWIEGRHFLLVDDVMTTGATVSEISRELKTAGTGRVCVVTVARG